MNKRQRKKNIKRAMERVNNKTATKYDKHILKTYGRKEFSSRYIMPPELIGFDASEFISNVAEAFRIIGFGFGEALENIGKNMKKMFGSKSDNDELKEVVK